jgi:hypothetical protein
MSQTQTKTAPAAATATAPAAGSATTTTPEAKVEAPALSYPSAREKLKGTDMEAVLRAWKHQKRTLCGDPKCYYPLNPTRTPTGNFEPQIEDTAKGRMIVGECSWDPRHEGGKQYIPVPVDPADEE